MNRKKVLEKRRQRIMTKIQSLNERAKNCTEVAELRAINGQLDDLKADIEDIDEEIKAIDLDEESNPTPPPDAQHRDFRKIGGTQTQEDNDSEPTNSVEYRTAFMNFVCRRQPIPTELRATQSTTTTDTSAVIPTVLITQIIEKIESAGMILSRVSHTSYPTGFEIPVDEINLEATWVGEGETSSKQKVKATSKVIFANHKLRCEVSITLNVKVASLNTFESLFVKKMAKAMVKACEKKIISGTGDGSPKGILNETPNDGQLVKVAKTSKLDYKLLCDIEAAIPEEYESTAVYAMTKKTFMNFMSMTDDNGQPIARVNFGIGGNPERTLLGREVVINPYMESYSDSPTTDIPFMFAFNFEDYAFNTAYEVTTAKREDWDTEDHQYKAVLLADGKVTNKDSLVIIKKLAGTTSV